MGSTETKADLQQMGFTHYADFEVDDEQPQHRVAISRDFYMGVHEVTLNQFLQYYNADKANHKTDAEKDGEGGFGYDGSKFEQKPEYVAWNTGWNKPVAQYMNHPVVNVSWNDSVQFCSWLTKKERAAGRIGNNQEYKLPTEAQWEYACRGGSNRSQQFSFGDSVSSLVKYANVGDLTAKKRFGENWSSNHELEDGFAFTSPVGSYPANGFGLYDMHGNVAEWCQDDYDESAYGKRKGTTRDPVISSEGSDRVNRGGSWYFAPVICRSAFRYWDSPGIRGDYLGFRVSLSSVQ